MILTIQLAIILILLLLSLISATDNKVGLHAIVAILLEILLLVSFYC